MELDLEFIVQQDQIEEVIWNRNIFVRREEGRGMFFRKGVELRKGVGLRIFCSSEREKKSRGEQVRRGVRGPVRQVGEEIVVELISQIDSEITGCCHIMQSITNQLAPSMLAGVANRKVALVRQFIKINCAIRTVLFF